MSKTTRKRLAWSRFQMATDALAPQSGPMIRSPGPTTAPSAPLEAAERIAGEETEAMSQFGIWFDGRSYRFRSYRYDHVRDALAYARLMQSRHLEDESSVTPAQDCVVQAPSDAQRQVMQQLSISFDAGTYKWGGFRYDKLSDAINYALMCANATTLPAISKEVARSRIPGAKPQARPG